jgi:uncharacterized small protein (DUF1192 family)
MTIDTAMIRRIADELDNIQADLENQKTEAAKVPDLQKRVGKLEAEVERLNADRQTLLGYKEQCEKMAAHPDVKKAAIEKARLDAQRTAAEALAAMHRLEAMDPQAAQPEIIPEIE